MFKSKLKAAAIHGLITLIVAILTALLVYGVWYRGELAQMMSGTDLYLLILIVEICLGPLMSLVIFNSNKPRNELIRDYCIVGSVQVLALVYGLYSVALSRPVYTVFVKDRIEIVAAIELKAEDIATARFPEFKKLPLWGAKSICTDSPTDPHEKSDLLLSALGGKDIQLLPKYYRSCIHNEAFDKSLPKSQLTTLTPIKIEELPTDIQQADFKWLPVSTRFGTGIVIYKMGDIESPLFLSLDPFGVGLK